MSEQLLDEFLGFLRPLITDDREYEGYVKHFKQRLTLCDESFSNSSSFKQLVHSTWSAVSKERNIMYVHLKNFLAELKAHKRKKKHLKKSSDSDSGKLPQNGTEKSKARVDHGIISESSVESPYNQEVTSTCSPSVSPVRKPQVVSDGPVSEQNCCALEYSSTSENVTNSEVKSSVSPIDTGPTIQEAAKSPVAILRDDSEGLPLPQASVLSTLNLVPRRVDLQPAKEESVSTSLLTDVPPEMPSTPEKTLGKALSRTEQGAKADGDTMKCSDVSSDSPSMSGYKDSASGVANRKCENALSELSSTSNGKVKPSCSKDLDSTSGLFNEKTMVSEKRIRKLEILLAKLGNEIEAVKERELSLDDLDDEDSSYIYEDRLQKKFVKVWDKLCELKGRRKTTGRPIEQRFTYEGARFPEINKKIERFINKKKMFPDFHDIRDIIIKVNKRKALNLSDQMVEMISRDTFMDVGNRLQERRRDDFVTTFGCRLTDSANPNDDPALRDPDLKAKLESNLSEGKQKMQDLILKYAHEHFNQEEEPEDQGDQSEKEKREMSCSPTNLEEEEEEVCVPELDEVLNDADCEPEEEISSEMKAGGNQDEDVIQLSTDEDEEEDDAQSDEDSENDDDRLPRTFTSVLDSMHQKKPDTEDDDSQDAVLEIKSESDDIQAINDVVEIGDDDDDYNRDEKSDGDNPTLVLDDSVYVDVAEDSDVLSISELSPITTENTETSDSDGGDPTLEMFKSPERRLKRSKLSIRTPQKSLLRKALGLKSPGKSPKRINFPAKKRSVECLDDNDEDSCSERNISSSVPAKRPKLSVGCHFSVNDPVISSSTGDPIKGQNPLSDDETEVIVLDSD